MTACATQQRTLPPECKCVWESEQDALHWGYYCACYDEGTRRQKAGETSLEVVYKLLLPPCASKMKDFMNRCPGRWGCPYMPENTKPKPALRPPMRRTRGVQARKISKNVKK